MGSSANKDYCAFTKAVEHLGDRWSLLIVRELFQFGPQGFNQLASGLPGTISRSVLAARLRKLEAVGVVARLGAGRSPSYTLAPAGEQLVPTLKSLRQWAEQWVPEDPAMAEADPTVIMWWLTHRVDVRAAPERQIVLELAIFGHDAEHAWLLIARDTEPTLCQEDPLLDAGRYVYVEAEAAQLYPIARGLLDWQAAISNGSVHLYGDPALVRELPTWFLRADVPVLASSPVEAMA